MPGAHTTKSGDANEVSETRLGPVPVSTFFCCCFFSITNTTDDSLEPAALSARQSSPAALDNTQPAGAPCGRSTREVARRLSILLRLRRKSLNRFRKEETGREEEGDFGRRQKPEAAIVFGDTNGADAHQKPLLARLWQQMPSPHLESSRQSVGE